MNKVPISAAGGSVGTAIVLAGPNPVLPSYPTFGDMLRASAKRAPDAVAFVHRTADVVETVSYAQALQRSEACADALRSFGLSQDRPLAILSQNSIPHAIVAMGAMLAGVPVAPISVPYSQISDMTRLRQVLTLLGPGLVFAEDGAAFGRGLKLAQSLGIPTSANTNVDGPEVDHCLDSLLSASTAGASGGAEIAPSSVAKVLFTSGSTGEPKGVIVTHGMICSNQAAMAELWPAVQTEPPVIVDWLAWNHTFGGNLVFNCAIHNAGTLVIDNGRPMPGLFAETVRNLSENPPTIHFGVPRGFDELINVLRTDPAFAERYFSRLRYMFTAGAALSADSWDAYRRLAKQHGRADLQIHVAWGATETSPVATMSPASNTVANNIGVPLPGAEIKMVPNEEKLELRVRGPMVMPGYWRAPELSAKAFDEDGFYRIGDAGKLLDPHDPSRGILFDGRTAENFKLATGTWVQVGALRLDAVTAGEGLIQDVAVAGQDREEIGLLVFLNLTAARKLAALPHADLAELSRNPKVREAVAASMIRSGKTGSSTRIGRAIILPDAPSFEVGEMTDKGYLNQRAVLRSRADLVERLFAEPVETDVILRPLPVYERGGTK
ncbi:AMP-binding protein [Hoeflea alexandrii]|uniref:AMP-binding protein n=1 Tax=Hoeflea alexandrii TaxID=288436 RepID=UPI0022B070CA|nr:AMP-binding protein [Hoeflea alexandrii]MCZ4292235.1 AMP-binding protein [Hoeflea alexandrii]